MGISREHLRLHSDENRIFITDLSSNGTWLNDRRLARGEPHPLAPGDAIKIPGFQLRIAPQDTPAAAPAAPQTTAQPARVDGPLGALRNVGASLSKVERLLIAFALATLGLVVLYFTS
jgi:predicted component of type VI protein secretion system